MLRSIKEMRGFTIQARDGEIGDVYDIYFDDQDWTLRYLVVETGGWLFGRRVLLAPNAIGRLNWSEQELAVNLTREQVKNSPEIDLDQPVSRQQESELHYYYGWSTYWTVPTQPPLMPGPGGATPYPAPAVVSEEEGERREDPHLRSAREVTGYDIKARDGGIGHVEDFLVDDESWTIHYLIVDTGNWLPGRKVLVSPSWAEAIDWSHSEVYIDLKRETIENSPEYDPSQPVERPYEEKLHQHYDQTRYWR